MEPMRRQSLKGFAFPDDFNNQRSSIRSVRASVKKATAAKAVQAAQLKNLPPNMQRIKETEMKLADRQNTIIDLAS